MNLPRVLIVEDEHALALALAAAVRKASVDSDLAPTAAQEPARDLRRSNRACAPCRFTAFSVLDGVPSTSGG